MTDAAWYQMGADYIESKMQDECVITRNHTGILSAGLNQETGELVQISETVEVYSGKCMVKFTQTGDLRYSDADQPKYRKVAVLEIPYDEVTLMIGDIVEITESFDPTQVGMNYRIYEVRHATHRVYRFAKIEDVQQDFNPTHPMT